MRSSEFENACQSTGSRSLSRRTLLQTTALAAAGALTGGRTAAQTPVAGGPNTEGGPAFLLPGFTAHRVETSGGVTINLVRGGEGPPLLLLHGAPQSHITWRHVAPRLAEDYTVIAADLRGYGDSSKPASHPQFGGTGAPDGHVRYSKRNMAQDQVDVMRHFGFDRFAVIGQDRGGRVTHRMLLDHPALVTKAAVLDILPTYYLYTHVTMAFIQTYYHWFSYVRAAPAPENDLIAGYDNAALKPPASDVQAEYRRVQNNPAGAHGMCEDYRAAASIDLVHDAADIDTKIGVPLLVLWADPGAMARLYDVLAVWRERGTHVSGRGMPGGHNMQEGAPEAVTSELLEFLRT
jgi:haloacetate dehalogenase